MNHRALVGELVSLGGVLAVLAGAVIAVSDHDWVLGFLVVGGVLVYFVGARIGRARGA